jgi:protein SCO1/2
MLNRKRRSNSLLALLFLAGVPGLEARDEELPSELVGVDVVEHIGTKVNLDLEFTAENGYPVPLRKFFDKGKPVLLNFVYYKCPMLCNLVLNAQTGGVEAVGLDGGQRVRRGHDQHRAR